MPVVKLSAIKGTDIPSLINSLERQRKELEFILQSLDDDNVLAINATAIKAGVVAQQHVEIGAATTYQAGYDPSGAITPGDLSALDGRLDTLEDDMGRVESHMGTAESNILTLQTSMSGVPTLIENARKVDSVTSDPVGAPIGKMWLRSDL